MPMRFPDFFLHASFHGGSTQKWLRPLDWRVTGWQILPFLFGQRLSESLGCKIEELRRELKIFLRWEEAFAPIGRARGLLVCRVALGTRIDVLAWRLLWSDKTSRRKELGQNNWNSLCDRLFYVLLQRWWCDIRHCGRSRLIHVVLKDKKAVNDTCL